MTFGQSLAGTWTRKVTAVEGTSWTALAIAPLAPPSGRRGDEVRCAVSVTWNPLPIGERAQSYVIHRCRLLRPAIWVRNSRSVVRWFNVSRASS